MTESSILVVNLRELPPCLADLFLNDVLLRGVGELGDVPVGEPHGVHVGEDGDVLEAVGEAAGGEAVVEPGDDVFGGGDVAHSISSSFSFAARVRGEMPRRSAAAVR